MRSAIDFRTANGDTNYPDADSILPVTDGEAANQTVLRRPTENARYRTETLRTFLQEHTLLQEAIPILYQGVPYTYPCITYGGAYPGGSGAFTTTTDLVVALMATAGGGTGAVYPFIRSTVATLSVGTPNNNEVVFTSVKKQYEGSTFPASNPNEIAVEIVAGGSLTVTLKGSSGNLNHIYVTIVSGTTTCTDLINAVNAAASSLVTASLGSGSTGTNAAALWGPTQWAGDYSQRFLKGGSAGVVHTVSPTALATFFAASSDNLMRVGDTIGIWYDKSVDTTSTGGRLQSTFENTNYAVPASSLFNSRREPWKLPNSIPLCKCVDSATLLFANGAVIIQGYPGSFGADSMMLLFANKAVLDTAWSWYSTEGILNRSGGHGHVPAVTVMDALDNTDEAVHALHGHTNVFVSVTDGVASTGGEYNGANGISLAVAALLAGNGGTILVRKGTYTLTAGLMLSKNIRIIGVEDGVAIVHNGSGYAFTVTAVNCQFENLALSSGSAYDLFNIQAADTTVTQCSLYSTAGTLVYANVNAKRLRFVNCQFTGAGTGQQLIQLIGGPSCVIDQCQLTVPDGSIGINSNPGVRLTVSNTKITCSPFTTDKWVINTEGGVIRFENVEWLVSGAGDITTGLLNIQADVFVGTALYFDMGNKRLHYATNNSPIILIGSAVEVNGMTIINAGLIPDAGTDGYSLSALVPYIRTTGFNGTVTIRTATIKGFSRNATPSGVCNFHCIGDQCVGSLGVPSVTNGRHVLEDVQIDFSGNTAISGVEITVAFGGAQPASIYRGCELILGTTGYLMMGWWSVDVESVTIDGCSILVATPQGLGVLLYALSSTAGCNGWAVINNSVKFADLSALGTGDLMLFDAPASTAQQHVISNNRIWNTSAVNSGQTMIRLRSGVNYCTVIGNTIQKGNASNTGIADAGSSNLSAGLNVIF